MFHQTKQLKTSCFFIIDKICFEWETVLKDSYIMLLENGEFDTKSDFIYDKDWADELFVTLLANSNNLLEYAKQNSLEEEFYKTQNIF